MKIQDKIEKTTPCRSLRFCTALLQYVICLFFVGCQAGTSELPEQALVIPYSRAYARIIVGDDLKKMMSMFEKSEKTKFLSFDEYEEHRQAVVSSKATQGILKEDGTDISAETQPCALVNFENEYYVYLSHKGVFFLFCTIDTMGDAFVFYDRFGWVPKKHIRLNKATEEECVPVFDILAPAYDGDSQSKWEAREDEAYNYMRRLYEKR